MATTRLRLGQLLVDAQLLSPQVLDDVLAIQKTDGRRLGTLLVERGLINETQLTQILSHQLSVPWVSLLHVDFSRQLLNLVPNTVAERYCLIPIYVRHVRGQGETLYVAMDDPSNEEALRECGRSSGLPVRAMIAPPSDIRDAIRVYYSITPAKRGADQATAASHGTATSPPVSQDLIETLPQPGVNPLTLVETPPEAPTAPAAASEPPEEPVKSAERAEVEAVTTAEMATVEAVTTAEMAAVEAVTTEEMAAVEAVTTAEMAEAAAAATDEPAADAAPAAEAAAAATDEPAADAAPAAEAAAAATDEPAADAAPAAEAAAAPAGEPAAAPEPSSATSETHASEQPPARAPGSTPEISIAAETTAQTDQTPQSDVPRSSKRRNPKTVSLTLLDGTTIALPTRPKATSERRPPGAELELTARDIIAALRAVSHGADASEVLGDNMRWEAMFAALLSVLLRKHLITDRELMEELKKI